MTKGVDCGRRRYINEQKARIAALAAGSRRAKTPQAVECEASQSGPKGNAQDKSA